MGIASQESHTASRQREPAGLCRSRLVENSRIKRRAARPRPIQGQLRSNQVNVALFSMEFDDIARSLQRYAIVASALPPDWREESINGLPTRSCVCTST